MNDKTTENITNKKLDTTLDTIYQSDFSNKSDVSDNDSNHINKKNFNEKINKLQLEVLTEEKKYLEIKLLSKNNINNLYNRLNKDIDKEKKFSLETYITNMLPIFDNIEYAINSIQKIKSEPHNLIYSQLKLIIKLLINLFNIFNIKIINDVNVLFNPDLHQAIAIEASETIKNNHVIKILQKGYVLNNRLLRPAMVIVAKSKR